MIATGRILTGLAALLVLGVAVLPAGAGLVDIRVDFNNRAATPSGWSLVADQTDTTTVHSLNKHSIQLRIFQRYAHRVYAHPGTVIGDAAAGSRKLGLMELHAPSACCLHSEHGIA